MTQVTATDNSKLQYKDFYIGQTRDEYVKTGGDVSLFNKIDKNDGVVTGTLSESDMLMYREQQVNKYGVLGVAGAAAAFIVAAGGACVVMKDLNRMQCADFLSGRMAIQNVYEGITLEILDQYDDYIARIRERIEDNLIELTGANRQAIAKFNAQVEVNNAQFMITSIIDKLREEIHAQKGVIR